MENNRRAFFQFLAASAVLTPAARALRWPTEKPDPKAFLARGDGDRIKARAGGRGAARP